MTEISCGESYPLKHYPAILAGWVMPAQCISRVDRKLEEKHLDTSVILAQDAPDATSHIGCRLASFNRTLGSAPTVTSQPLAKIRCLAYVDAVLVAGGQLD
jgi:hypothetical protein